MASFGIYPHNNTIKTICPDVKLLKYEELARVGQIYVDAAGTDNDGWESKYERQEDENEPIALILCASKSDAIAEFLELSGAGIHVAEYITKFIPKNLIEQKLIDSIKNAKIMLEQRNKKDSKIQ